MGGFNETPEDDDPGFNVEGYVPDDGSSCTFGVAPANCIDVEGHDVHVSSITVSVKMHGSRTGRWKVTRNGNLFLRSGVVTVYDGYAWEWQKNWVFNDGDRIAGGFWLSTGSWYADIPAGITIHS